MEEALEQLAVRAARLGAPLEPDQIESLGGFCRHLEDYNSHTNLVANADPAVVARDHILDSLTLVPVIRSAHAVREDGAGLSLVDIGSGAGFPGLILAVVLRKLSVTLVESIGKKTRFLESAARALRIRERIRVINDRAESLGHDSTLRESFHLATARAVGSVDVAAELTMPLLRIGGLLLLQKSRAQLADELLRAGRCLSLLGAGEPRIESPDAEALGKQHVILVIEKTGEIDAQYPRSPAAIKRHPLGDHR